MVAAMVAFLRDHAELIRGYDRMHAWVAFPPRKQPATRAEVAKHEAVFALEGLGPTRIVDLPRMPTAGKWVTYLDLPTRQQRYEGGKLVEERGFFQEGFIVQAEEVQVDGRWQRYYGFEGCNQIVKVPAEEIEIATYDYNRSGTWFRCSGTFEIRLAPPRGTIDLDEIGPPRCVLGESVPIRVTLRNGGGLTDNVPDLNRHVRLRAWYSPAVIAPEGMLVPAADQDIGWDEMATKAGEFSRETAGRKLNSGGELEIDGIDLAARFAFRWPGFYRVHLVSLGAPEKGGKEVIFSLAAPP
jgi:hypothetical protein